MRRSDVYTKVNSPRTKNHRARWAAFGAAVAVSLGGGGLAFVQAADEPDSAVFDTITRVRVFDTRNGTGGVAAEPIGAGETLEVVMAGANGVPADATAVVLNVTAVRGTDQSFLTVFPTGDPLPLASSVNWTDGAASPNSVTAPIGTDGKVSFYNFVGDVDVFADVSGYYTPANRAPYMPIAVQATSSPSLPAVKDVVETIDITLPDVCPGAVDTWTVEVDISGYFLTGLAPDGSATTGISLDGTEYEPSSVINQNFKGTPTQFREIYARTNLVTLDAGTHTISQLGSTNMAAGVTAAQNALIAKSVSVTC